VAGILLYNLAIFLFCFGLLEAGATVFHTNPDRFEGEYRHNCVVSDEILGYAPRKNIRVSSLKYHDDKLLYDVTYTFDKEGLRTSSSCEGPGCGDAILFFGCSVCLPSIYSRNTAFRRRWRYS